MYHEITNGKINTQDSPIHSVQYVILRHNIVFWRQQWIYVILLQIKQGSHLKRLNGAWIYWRNETLNHRSLEFWWGSVWP